MPMHTHTFGFSLIELMIVVSILAILATIAIPSYQHYTGRARFAEIIAIADTFKTAVSIALQQGEPSNELTPGTHGIPNTPPATKNFAELAIENGVITATATDLAQNATYILTPNNDGSTWTVSGTCLAYGFCNT